MSWWDSAQRDFCEAVEPDFAETVSQQNQEVSNKSNNLSINYKESYFEYHNKSYTDELLRMLRGEVFHVTSKKAFEMIKNDGFIFHNQQQRFALNASSANSFGRKFGMVCLLDLRETSDEHIREALKCYYFLWPPWFGEYNLKSVEMNLAYLILDGKYYDKLISYEIMAKSAFNKLMRVPGVECWYPGDLPLSFIRETILVKIILKAQRYNRFLYAHHMMEVMFGSNVK
jgi:hypothetical protein